MFFACQKYLCTFGSSRFIYFELSLSSPVNRSAAFPLDITRRIMKGFGIALYFTVPADDHRPLNSNVNIQKMFNFYYLLTFFSVLDIDIIK